MQRENLQHSFLVVFLRGCFAFRRDLLFNRLKSRQKIAETPLVSDFRFYIVAHGSHQRGRLHQNG